MKFFDFFKKRPRPMSSATHYLLSLGLVPVQSWLAEARRSRDLRAGSVILWWTMARVLHTLERQAQARFLLPPEPDGGFARLAGRSLAQALEEPYGIPNRATGWTGKLEPEAARELFAGLEDGPVADSWAEVRRFLFDPELTERGPQDRREFFRALQGPLEAYRELAGPAGDCPFSLVWVAKAIEPPDVEPPNVKDPESLRGLLLAADRLYADVKRTRPIKPWTLGQRVPKCNQCGRREAVGPASSTSAWRDWERETWGELAWLERGYVVDADERLCAVCLSRRLAGYARAKGPGGGARWRFASTGEVAAANWLDALREADSELGEILERIEQTARAEGSGEEDLSRVLYASEAALREAGHEELAELRGRLAARIGEVNRARPAPLPAAPPRYLALLTFDGDSMGETIRRDPEGVPRALEAFQTKARSAIRNTSGEIFYLAGDEGLAMAPAGAALELALELPGLFEASFEGREVSTTVSAGLAFFEQSRPLGGAIEMARQALREAKALPEKAALGVVVETASGSRWGLTEPWGPGWERIGRCVELVREGRLAAGWAYDVERFLRSLEPSTWRVAATEPGVVEAEIERLFVRRALPRRPTGNGSEAASGKTLREEARDWWRRLDGASWWGGQVHRGPRPDQFHLIGFLGRQWVGAAGERSGGASGGSGLPATGGGAP